MTAESTEGESAGKKPMKMLVHAFLFTGCLIFSSFVYALPQAETDTGSELIGNVQTDVVTEQETALKANSKCLKCHSREKFKSLEDGEEMPLQVHPETFAGSVHGGIRCVSCHEAIGSRKHPSKRTNITISSHRDYAVEMNKACSNCHAKTFAEYEGSVHAKLVAQGDAESPVCTGCHSAHAVETMADYRPESGLPCKNCHELIFNAYSESVHGEARLHANVIRDKHIQASICADCHGSHNANAVAIGDPLRSACFGCHENVTLLHSQWLPNAGTHLDIVSCAVCHAPFAKSRFDLHLFDNVAQTPVGQDQGHELYEQKLKEIEAKGDDADPLAVWREVVESARQSKSMNVSIRGRMEVVSGITAHLIAPKRFSVRTCDSCHQKGSKQRQNVTVSIPQSGGGKQILEADRNILKSVVAMDSISDFYALGGNPNKLLDVLFLLSLASGIAIPIGHFTIGRMVKEKMERGER